MFPIPWNFPFRKKDGSLGKIEDLGGSYSLPTASADTKGGVKIGNGLTMAGESLSADSQLPSYSTAEAGKILTVDETGLLEWANASGGDSKLYYKDYNLETQGKQQIASYDSGTSTASGSGWYIGYAYNAPSIQISGYRPILATVIDVYTGYEYGMLYNVWNDGTMRLGAILSRRGGDWSGATKLRVYYVKNENIEPLT